MPTFTVHQPPPKPGETTSTPERFLFLRDGFHFWAFVLAPFWLLRYQLWVGFVVYLASSAVIAVVLGVVRAPLAVQLLAGVLVALLIGFEGATIRRGWKMLGFVVGDNTEMAERRFFAEWVKRAETPPPSAPLVTPESVYAKPRRPPSPSDVIGLFPKPGGGR
jgi:hypothetical protein